jgi:hypothetical protein
MSGFVHDNLLPVSWTKDKIVTHELETLAGKNRMDRDRRG